LGKGITGGYLPLAATMVTDEIYGAFLGEYDEFKTFFHGHTYTGNPLGCAAALASLDLFEKKGFFDALGEKAALLNKGLQGFNTLPHVGDIRQAGLMAGIELVQDKDSREPFAPGLKTGIRVIMEARKRGVIIRPLGDVIVLMPPLSISLKELDMLIEVVYDSIKAAARSV